MIKYLKRNLVYLLMVLLPMVLTVALLSLLIAPAKPRLSRTISAANLEQKELINFVAIGDSLTEGVGDTTQSGGFVPLLKKDLQAALNYDPITAYNFGKAGDRSDQVLKRIKKTKDIGLSLQRADFITLTVGGNDLMKVIRSEILNDITDTTFEKPLKKYQKNLTDLIAEIREYAPDAPIYLMGIYNPFYLSFQEVVEMQDIVTMWNNGAEEVINETANAYFIPINDSLYRGLDGQVGIGRKGETSSSSEESANNLISQDDNFHPNNLGYQIMANAFKEKLLATQVEWLKK